MAEERNMNRDPITDEPGSHPLGTGVGAAGGAMAGAALGALGGPVGAAVGGVMGAVAGGLSGSAVGEAVNPTAEMAYWRENYSNESYYETGRTFDDYGPAYGLAVSGRGLYPGTYEAAKPHLANRWSSERDTSRLSWEQAEPATRAAWTRLGDSGYMSTGVLSSDANMPANDDVIDTLEDLVESCRDGEYGFNDCAHQATRADLKSLFAKRAGDCASAARELEQCIVTLGGQVEDKSGTTAGALHRGWVAVKAALTTVDDAAVLSECERGEDRAVAAYRKALKESLPATVRTLVQRQADGAQRNHDEIRDLRDKAKLMAA